MVLCKIYNGVGATTVVSTDKNGLIGLMTILENSTYVVSYELIGMSPSEMRNLAAGRSFIRKLRIPLGLNSAA